MIRKLGLQYEPYLFLVVNSFYYPKTHYFIRHSEAHRYLSAIHGDPFSISLLNASFTYILMSMKLTPVHAYILYVHNFFVIHHIYIYIFLETV